MASPHSQSSTTHSSQPPSDPPTQPEQRDLFSGAWAAAIATAGVAIGLGNVWRFPYMMGQEGGGAFLALYLVLVAVLGVPALMAEWALGRATRRGPWGAYKQAGLPFATGFSLLILLTITMAASYYGVIVAKVLQDAVVYTARAVTRTSDMGALATGADWLAPIFTVVTIALACGVDAMGMRKGVERLSKIALLLAAALLIALVVRAVTLPGAWAGVRILFVPRFEDITATTALKATGQVFFSLALGGMFMVAYGARMRDDTPIPRTAVATALADVVAALLAALIVIPAAVATGVAIDSGPALLFDVMPRVFAQTRFGNALAASFFVAIALMALLSLIAAYEALAQALEIGLGWSRRRAMTLVGVSQALLSIPAITINNYIGASDLIWGTTMQPIGACIAVIALVWCIGRAKALEEMRRSSKLPVPGWLIFHLRWVTPGAIVAILFFGWVEQISG